MESYIVENVIENLELKASGTTEEFQVFFTNLFEKNGVLNDLRAHLRGHIVTFLRSMENGDIPESQKHFTQRLQFKFQAINAVIAEYLIKLKFGYSSSVFISEIPLANMVFDFTKTIFASSNDTNLLQFSASDIMQILNYLGIQCDQKHITKLLEDYQKDDEPLLMCILKNTSLFNDQICDVKEASNADSLSLNSYNMNNKNKLKCEHYMCCKSCQIYISRMKEKYKKRKKRMAQFQNILKLPLSNLNVTDMMTKMKIIEKNLIEEMFEQLKHVYEGEIEILREGNEKTVKHSLANHTSLMQKHRLELEKEMESRSIAMQTEFRERKEFVTGLAATLKEAHYKLRDARHKLKKDAEDLVNRENKLKTQLQEAEKTLKIKGEEMQKQISHELKLLDEQHHNLKKEKNVIDSKRQEIENLKKLSETNLKLLTSINVQERANLVKQYDAMNNDLDVLKKYIAMSNENKSNQDVVVNVNNNETIYDSDDRVKLNHVVNYLKKMKNVNFSQTVSTMCHKWCHDNVISESKCDGTCSNTLKLLREEHQKLKEFSKQQSSHIELLSLSLRQINQAASTCPNINTVSRQTFLKEKNREDINSAGNASTKDSRDVLSTSKKSTNIMESQEVTLNDCSPKTLRATRDLLKKKHKDLFAEEDESSNKMIREAKLRLRKLEIEAEAVERSYLKFRQHRAQENRLYRNEDSNTPNGTPKMDAKEKIKRNSRKETQDHPDADETKNKRSYEIICQQTNLDFDKYLRKYHDDDKSTVSGVMKYNKIDEHKYRTYKGDEERKREWRSFNYLETPLTEFRKLYESSTHRATKSSIREKQNKIDSVDIPTEKSGMRRTDTRKEANSQEVQNINTLDESIVKKTNTTLQTTVGDILYDEEADLEITNNTQTTKKSEDDKGIVIKLNNKYNKAVNTNANLQEITKMSKDNKNSLAEEHKNSSLDLSGKEFKEMNIKETTEAFTEIILKVNGRNVEDKDSLASSTLQDLSDLKTKVSEHDISVKSSDNVEIHIANAGADKIDDANRLVEVDDHVNNTAEQMNNSNGTNKKECLSQSDSLKESAKNINNSEEINVDKSMEIEKHSNVEYEEDFSIPIFENSLSENNFNSPISIQKSSAEETFWD